MRLEQGFVSSAYKTSDNYKNIGSCIRKTHSDRNLVKKTNVWGGYMYMYMYFYVEQ